MAIVDWPVHERPREKLLAHGPAALSDAELLAIFLRVGMPGKSAVDLARAQRSLPWWLRPPLPDAADLRASPMLRSASSLPLDDAGGP